MRYSSERWIRKGTLLIPYTGELDVFTVIKVKVEPPKS
jgi:hypothetical protein